MVRFRDVLTLTLGLCLLWSPAGAQQAERTPAPANEHFDGYLAGAQIDFRLHLAPPPTLGSLEDALDVVAVNKLQADATQDRWALAVDDGHYVYPEFEAVFGRPIDHIHAPHLVHLLNETMHDVSKSVFASKVAYGRERPYQRWQLARVCGEAVAPPPEANPSDRSSYPSGHAAFGWATALILAEIMPTRASAILARGEDYGLSRVICGMHFPSDVAAGRQLAEAVVARLNVLPAFERDLQAAREEEQVSTN